MIVFKNKQEALKLRKRAFDALKNESEINAKFDSNPEKYIREARFLDNANEIIQEATEYIKRINFAEIDSKLGIN